MSCPIRNPEPLVAIGRADSHSPVFPPTTFSDQSEQPMSCPIRNPEPLVAIVRIKGVGGADTAWKNWGDQ